VLKEVSGLKWGSYVGSPAEKEPKVVWEQTSKDRTITACLLPLSTNEVYGLPPGTVCLVQYTKEKGLFPRFFTALFYEFLPLHDWLLLTCNTSVNRYYF